MIIDSHAWIEYLIGSENGAKVKEALLKNKCFTCIVSISEIAEWCLKNNKDIKNRIELVKTQSNILYVDEATAILAAKLNFERKKKIVGWGLIDSFILATALMYGLTILTGDKHFSDIENAVML
jgi:predicted nucleic acid-binding protein